MRLTTHEPVEANLIDLMRHFDAALLLERSTKVLFKVGQMPLSPLLIIQTLQGSRLMIAAITHQDKPKNNRVHHCIPQERT